MVTFNNAGRYGNWFMEMCTALAYALRHNLPFHAPNGHGKDSFWYPVYCTHLCNPNYNPSLEEVHLWESAHHYQELPFEESWRDKNIVIEGYRQSEKYFKDYRTEILYLLNYPYDKREGVVAVHVRRGDYLHLTQKHPPVTKEWYESVMAKFPGYKFQFYSDDIDWCIREFGHRGDCDFSVGKDAEFDCYDGACCEHQIISASTFGWAMAWLNRNPDKKIYIPRLWFVEGWDGLDVKDIVPEEWVKL